MFSHLIVPVDASTPSFQAVRIAAEMVASVNGTLEVITVIDHADEAAVWHDELNIRLGELGPLPVAPQVIVRVGRAVGLVIAERLETMPGSMVLMSSHGHGRSAAVLGSTTDEILRETFGPLIVIGPNASAATGRLDGRYVVPLDGSDRADTVLPIVGAWTVEFGGTPWLVEVIDPEARTPLDVAHTVFVQRRANDLRTRIEREVEFEALHGSAPGRAIAEFADDDGAALIFMATHGRTGLARLRTGSVAADVVRHASCPVVLFRPPELSGRASGAPLHHTVAGNAGRRG